MLLLLSVESVGQVAITVFHDTGVPAYPSLFMVGLFVTAAGVMAPIWTAQWRNAGAAELALRLVNATSCLLSLKALSLLPDTVAFPVRNAGGLSGFDVSGGGACVGNASAGSTALASPFAMVAGIFMQLG